jgi:hypothetical protein
MKMSEKRSARIWKLQVKANKSLSKSPIANFTFYRLDAHWKDI